MLTLLQKTFSDEKIRNGSFTYRGHILGVCRLRRKIFSGVEILRWARMLIALTLLIEKMENNFINVWGGGTFGTRKGAFLAKVSHEMWTPTRITYWYD